MHIEITKKNGQSVGWDIVADSLEDQKILGTMRDLQFWGLGDTVIRYDGMESSQVEIDGRTVNVVNRMSYIQLKHKK